MISAPPPAPPSRFRHRDALGVDILVQLRPVVGNDFHPCSCVYAEYIERGVVLLPPTASTTTQGCGSTTDNPNAVLSGACGRPNYVRIPFSEAFVFNQSIADNWALTLTVIGATGGTTDEAANIE